MSGGVVALWGAGVPEVVVIGELVPVVDMGGVNGGVNGVYGGGRSMETRRTTKA